VTTSTIPGGGAFHCTIKVDVTSSGNLGALKYAVDYTNASGEFDGTGFDVQCTSVSGPSGVFFDDDPNRSLSHSLIALNGFNTPVQAADCKFTAPDAAPVAGDFAVSVLDASDTQFEPVTAVVQISSITCTP
jgi:hypothetical protein